MKYMLPLEDNYYALYLAIVYPCFLTADEALHAIKYGVNPIAITEQTIMEGFRLSKKKKEPAHYDEYLGRRYEIVRLLAGVIKESNEAMRTLRDYELEGYKENVLSYMKALRERKEKQYNKWEKLTK